MKLKYENIYADTIRLHIISEHSLEVLEKLFLNAIYKEFQALELQGFDAYVENMNFSGFFSTKTQVLTVEFKKSKLKRHSACFFIEENGNAYSFRLYKGVDKKYFEGLNEKPLVQRLEFIKNRLPDFEHRHDFSSFDALMDKLFTLAMSKIESIE